MPPRRRIQLLYHRMAALSELQTRDGTVSCWLPDFAGVFADHRVPFFAPEGFRECIQVRKRAVAAEARQRVRVGVGLQAGRFCALIRAPHLRPTQEEALLWREAVDLRRTLAGDGFFVRRVGDGEPSEIADAF